MRLLPCYLKVIMSFATTAMPKVTPTQTLQINQPDLLTQSDASLASGENQESSEPKISIKKKAESAVGLLVNSNESQAVLESHTAPSCNSSVSTSAAAEQSPHKSQLVLLQASAFSGNSTAQYDLGQCFEFGISVKKNHDEAKCWYLRAAEQGHVRAQYCLGLLYSQGRQIVQDYEQAVYWFRKAADQNDPCSQCNLGAMYASGRGVDQDDDEALLLYTKAALQGHARAQFKLGLAFANGRGVEQNDMEAVSWYLKAAQQGLANAQSALAVRYSTGRGVDLDDHQAAYWYKKAAEQGHAMACNNLQKCYREGKGVELDLKLATYWSLKAGFNDGDVAIQMVDELESIELIASVLKEFPEFRNVRKLVFANPFLFPKQIVFFEAFMKENPCFTSLDFLRVCFDSSAPLLSQFLKSNITVTQLLFDEEFIDKKIMDPIKNSLIQNSAITYLRQHFAMQLTQPTTEYPVELVALLIEHMIVLYLKFGHSKEKTQEAMDEFLLIASVKQ